MSHIFIITTPLIKALLYLTIENLLTITILGIIFLTLFIYYIYSSINRRESLNIIKDNNIIYFNLSDDELFSIKIDDNEILSDALLNAIKEEFNTIKDIVDRVDFINFRDDKLYRELNEFIQKNID